MTPCPECSGTGEAWVEREIYHRQSFNIDSGHVESAASCKRALTALAPAR